MSAVTQAQAAVEKAQTEAAVENAYRFQRAHLEKPVLVQRPFRVGRAIVVEHRTAHEHCKGRLGGHEEERCTGGV